MTNNSPSNHPLLEAWGSFLPQQPPYLLAGDEVLLEPEVRDKWTCSLDGWSQYVAQDDARSVKAGRLQLGLLPMPFAGDLLRARAYVLLLNPGWEPLDYFAEWEVPAFRAAVLANYAQAPSHGMFFLDPQFAWHGGGRYWNGRLKGVITALSARLAIPHRSARQRLQQDVCVLEMFAYHSAEWRLPSRIEARLRSSELVRTFVHDVLQPRASAGEATIIVTRKCSEWGLRPGRGIVVYEGMSRRGAHIGPTSRGGAALLEQLARDDR